MAGVKGRSGGARFGAGRRPKTAEQRALGGFAGHRSNAETRQRDQAAAKDARARRDAAADEPVPAPSAPPADETPSAPVSVKLPSVHDVWTELAPFAQAQGTLTTASRLSFEHLCELVAVQRALFAQICAEGWTVYSPSGDKKAHPLLVRYQGISRDVKDLLTRFNLSPVGREMGFGKPPDQPGQTGASAPPADPFAEFEAPGGIQ